RSVEPPFPGLLEGQGCLVGSFGKLQVLEALDLIRGRAQQLGRGGRQGQEPRRLELHQPDGLRAAANAVSPGRDPSAPTTGCAPRARRRLGHFPTWAPRSLSLACQLTESFDKLDRVAEDSTSGGPERQSGEARSRVAASLR